MIGPMPAFTPMAWADQAKWPHVVLFGFGVVWLVLWLLNAIWLSGHRKSLFFAIVPIGVFLWSAYEASIMAYACNIF